MAAKFKVGDRVFLSRNGWCLIRKLSRLSPVNHLQHIAVQMVDGAPSTARSRKANFHLFAS